MNFPEAKLNASWDDTIYDAATLNAMAKVRAHNIQLMENIDARLQEMQRKFEILLASSDPVLTFSLRPSTLGEESWPF